MPVQQQNTNPYSSSLGTLSSILGNYAGSRSGSRVSPLFSTIGGLLGSQAGNLISGQGLNLNQVTSPGMMGNIGGSLGALLGGRDNRWAAPVGRAAGTLLSPLIQGKNILDSVGTAGTLQGLGSSLGGAFGGRGGGIAGTIGGNLLGNTISGLRAGQDVGGILSNIGSFGNLASVGGALLPFLLPKGMDPEARTTVGNMASQISSALAGSTLGSTVGSTISNWIGPLLSNTPIGLVTGILGTALAAWQGAKEDKALRHADEKNSWKWNKYWTEGAPQYKPIMDNIMKIGQDRISSISSYVDSLAKADPKIDVAAKKQELLQKYGIADDLYGLTENEMATLFGMLGANEGNPYGSTYANPRAMQNWWTDPAQMARSSISQHWAPAPYTTPQRALMTQAASGAHGNIDPGKIIPWLNWNTQKIQNYDRYMSDPTFRESIDKNLALYSPLGAQQEADQLAWLQGLRSQDQRMKAQQEEFAKQGGMF